MNIDDLILTPFRINGKDVPHENITLSRNKMMLVGETTTPDGFTGTKIDYADGTVYEVLEVLITNTKE